MSSPANIPTKEGWWFRKVPGFCDNIVMVYDGINDAGRMVPLGWYMEGFGDDRWVCVEDDGLWIREVRVDDVPAEEVARLRAGRDAATARIEELEASASSSTFSDQQAEVDALRAFAADMGTLVDADPSDLKALSAAVKQMILTIGMQRLTLEDVERLDAELREKMAQALDRARSKAKVEGAKEERARILAIVRERAASRTAQITTHFGVAASLAHAKASECEALATMIDDTAPASPEKLIE